MSVAALNVRIGGDIRELNKALKDAEKAVRTASSRIGEAARDLSTKLTLPLIGFGVVAIKAAGEIEALQKAMAATFQGAGRSLSEAATEVDNLRKAAEAPGLDFEQAIKASLRLQGVGLSAENARETIVQLANAIATSRGTAENLNGVTVQLAQIISKGKILNSDLMVMKENMPGLAKVMQDTFGTDQADRLREMGVDGKEFVEKITAAMAKLPRVEGGISNSIVNAGTAIKMFLASVGESLNKTFNISTKLDGFAKWLGGLAEGFSNLDEGTKKLIAGVGVFAIALGPMLKVGQGVVVVVGAMIKAFNVLQVTLLKSIAGEAIPSAIKAFQALNLATKLTILGAAIGVVLAAAAAFKMLEEDTSAAAMATKSVNEVMKTAEAAVASERISVDLLIGTIKSNTAAYVDKKKALDELKAISPAYFGNLDLEKLKVEDVTKAQNLYIDSLLRGARAKAAQDKLIEIDRKRSELQEKLSRATANNTSSTAQNSGIGGSIAMDISRTNAKKTFTQALNEEIAALEEQDKKLREVINTNRAATPAEIAAAEATKKATAVTEAATGKTKGLREEKDRLKETTKAAKKAEDDYLYSVEAEIRFQNTINKNIKEEIENREKIKKIKKELGDIPTLDLVNAPKPGAPKPVAEGYKPDRDKTTEEAKVDRIKQMKEGLEALPTLAETAAGAMSSFGESVASSLEQSGASWKSFAMAAVDAIAKVINHLIKMTVAKAIASAIEKGSVINPLVGIALAGVAGTLAGSLFKKLVGAAAFAKGTMNAPGGMALVGEEGPELINLPARSQVYTASQTKNILGGGGGGNVSVSGEFTVRGTDLVLVLDRVQNKQTRHQ